MSSLSERVINSANDLNESLFQCRYIQKILMTGDTSGDNKAIFQRDLWHLDKINSMTAKILAKTLNLQGLKPDEKTFFEKMISELPTGLNKFLEEYNSAVGPVPESIKSEPLINSVVDYVNIFEQTLDKGSVIETMVVMMAEYAVPLAVQNYLANNPAHKESHVTNLALMKPMNLAQALQAIKGMIDERAGEVSGEAEAQLIALYRRAVQTQVNVVKEMA